MSDETPKGLNATSAPTVTAAANQLFCANRHIPNFLALCSKSNEIVEQATKTIQFLDNGKDLTATSLLNGTLDISRPILVQDTPESMGMTVFRPPRGAGQQTEETVTVRHVADVIGHLYPVRVMDVEHQEELEGWTMGDLVDYFEDEDRLQRALTNNALARQQPQHQQNEGSCTVDKDNHGGKKRSQRKAAQKASNLLVSKQNRPRILNQISLEFSNTDLRNTVVSPQFVRDLDWIDNCWPSEMRNNKQPYPSVQYYCLTSTAGCYTDFHCDFGGTSVWYHILSGSKRFCLIAPTKQNLAIYEQWLGHHDQESIFLPDLIPNQTEVITVSLKASQTLFIPSGWIHAVYTPDDAVVVGGNLLHTLAVPLQLEISAIEHRTRVPDKFRFPYFRKMHFYVASCYLQKLRNNDTISTRELKNMPDLLNALEAWIEETSSTSIAVTQNNKGSEFQDAALYAAAMNGCTSVSAFLLALRNEYERARGGQGRTLAQEPQFTKPTSDLRLNPFGIQGLMIIPHDGSPREGNCLRSPKSPKIRLKLKTGSSKKGGEVISASTIPSGGFRIVISSVAKELQKPLPRPIMAPHPRKGKFREDMEYVDLAHDDDDWVPSPSLHKQHSNVRANNKSSKKTMATNKRRGPGQVGIEPKSSHHGRPPAAKKPKTTARQRLLKKFR